MAHSLMRIKSSLTNTPHLIEQSSFNGILEYVNQRIAGGVDIIKPEAKYEEDEDFDPHLSNYNEYTKTGVMYIDGSLTYRKTGWESWCGGTSYEGLKEQMEAFVGYGAKTVVWLANSGGGEAHSMIDTAKYLRKLANDNGINIIAYVDGMAASACYGLVCEADEIIMSADSQVGSIGVLIQLMNNSKALEKAGYERTFLKAGKNKIPFDESGAFTEAFTKGLQEQVDVLYEGFTAHVAQGRGLSQDVIKGTEASMFMAKEAIELGLVDKQMTVEEFYIYLADVAQEALERGDKMSNKLGRMFNFNKTEDHLEMAKLEEMQATLQAVQAELTGVVAAKEELTALLSAQQEALVVKEAELSQALASIEELKELQATAKVDKRKQELSAVLSADKVEATLESLAPLDDAAFAVVLGSLSASKAITEASEMMTEIGGEGEEVVEESAVEDKATLATKAILDRMKRR